MSQQSNYNQARTALQELKEKLLTDFSVANGGPINGIGLGRISTAEYCVKVMLQRNASEDEKNLLPVCHKGVKVEYQLVGPIKAL